MQTRETSPFQIHKCEDTGCNNTVPDSTGRDLCTTCSNIAMTLGERPSQIDSAKIEKMETPYSPKHGYRLTVNGESRESTFYSKEHRNSRFRERKSLVRLATDD